MSRPLAGGTLPTGPGGPDLAVELGRYPAVLWRRKWWVLATAVLCMAVAALSARGATVRSYRSTAEVLVRPITANPLEAPVRPDRAVDVDTESRVLASVAVAELAAAGLGAAGLGAGESAEALLGRVSTEVTSETQVLTVAFTDPSAAGARAGAQAFAEAYLRYRADEARRGIATVREAINARLAELDAELGTATATMAVNPPESAAFLQAQAQRNSLRSEIALLSAQLAGFAAVEVDPGRILRPAAPAVPAHPGPISAPLAGAMGVLAGAAVAFGRDRLDNRLHHRPVAPTVAGLTVLAAIPRRRRAQRDEPIAAEGSADAEAYRRLAAKVVASHRDGPCTVVVTGPSPGEGTSTVAANLAVALARGGVRTALLSADFRAPGLRRLFGLGAGPAVNDVLAGHVADDAAERRPAATPSLAVYPSRVAAGEPGKLLRSDAWTAFLRRLGDRHQVVVVDGPPVLPGEDALPLAAAATATILVGRQHRTSHGALEDAADRLAGAGARISGTVVTRTAPGGRDVSYSAAASARQAAQRRRVTAVAAASAALVAVAGAAAAPDLVRHGEPAPEEAQPSSVAGVTATRPAVPPATTTTTAPPPTTTTAPPPTTTTAPPPTTTTAATTTTTRPPTTTTTTTRPPTTTTTTTTTTRPRPISPASASADASGVKLLVEATPGDDGRDRSVSLRITAGFSESSVLRVVRIDYGDGTVSEPPFQQWLCVSGAPNPHVVAAPTKAYGSGGTFPVTVTATTARCSPYDDDWGPESDVSVRLTLAVP